MRGLALVTISCPADRFVDDAAIAIDVPSELLRFFDMSPVVDSSLRGCLRLGSPYRGGGIFDD